MKLFKFLSKKEDYAGMAIGRGRPTVPDKMVIVLNDLDTALAEFKKIKIEVQEMMAQLYKHALSLVETNRILELRVKELEQRLEECNK